MIAEAQATELDQERRAVARAQAGDTRALERVLARHAEALFSQVVLPRLGDRAAAEDVVRDSLVSALENIGRFEWQERSVFVWLRRIALNRLIDLHRQRGRAERLIAALEQEVAAATAGAADDALIAAEDRARARVRIDEILARLPERQSRAIRLRLVEERPRQECAALLGVEVGNFDVILFRALRAFRRDYGER